MGFPLVRGGSRPCEGSRSRRGGQAAGRRARNNTDLHARVGCRARFQRL